MKRGEKALGRSIKQRFPLSAHLHWRFCTVYIQSEMATAFKISGGKRE